MNMLGQSLKSPENPQIPKGFLNPQISYFWGFIPQGWAPWTGLHDLSSFPGTCLERAQVSYLLAILLTSWPPSFSESES